MNFSLRFDDEPEKAPPKKAAPPQPAGDFEKVLEEQKKWDEDWKKGRTNGRPAPLDIW